MEGPKSTRTHVRRRPVTFGNPSTVSYRGFVYLGEPGTIVEDALMVDNVVAMVHVPPEQVPDGVLHIARAHQPWIRHLRIVIEEPPYDNNNDNNYDNNDSNGNNGNNDETTEKNEDEALQVQKETHQRESDMLEERLPGTRNSADRSYLVLLEVADAQAAQEMVRDLHQQPYTSLDETQVCYIYHVVALRGQDGVSLISILFAPPTSLDRMTSVETTDITDMGPRKITADERAPLNCPVCLEQLHTQEDTSEVLAVLTTVCNHSFHVDCLLQWQDSTCPVCRYDHSGLNQDAILSPCETCGSTSQVYVCLICGVVSCASTATVSSLECHEEESTVVRDEAVTAARLSQSHARQHYHQTLHAYALDTRTQHVWDFAGGGYVHRLLQNKDDGKLVEMHDPNNMSSEERTLSPGLSDAQESEVVHRKLEGFASQYHTLLKSQLEQQRIYYEGRLEELRREHSDANQRKRSSDLIHALRQEQKQLSHRLETLQNRLSKVQDNVSFLTNMNESLEANKISLKEEIAVAQQERINSQKYFEEKIPVLQETVTRLMLSLEDHASMQEHGKPSAI